MRSEQEFKKFTAKYDNAGSWAIWDPLGDKPKSNTGGMNWVTPDLWKKVRTDFVFVGLNLSRELEKQKKGQEQKQKKEPWRNFHSSHPTQNDFKLRYALTGTKFWGSYLTDLIKDYEETKSGNVIKAIRKDPEILRENIKSLEEELSFFPNKPVLIAMGTDVFKLLKNSLGSKYNIVKIKHYSCRIGKEKYRDEVLNILGNIK